MRYLVTATVKPGQTQPLARAIEDGTLGEGSIAGGEYLRNMGNLKQLAQNKPDDKQIGRVEAIISSMTLEERRNTHIINGSRRKRIARGSGTTVEEVNRLLKQFAQMRKMMKAMGGLAGAGGGSRKARARLGSLIGRMN